MIITIVVAIIEFLIGVYVGTLVNKGDQQSLPDKDNVAGPSFIDVEDLPKILVAYGSEFIIKSISANGTEINVTLPDMEDFLKRVTK